MRLDYRKVHQDQGCCGKKISLTNKLSTDSEINSPFIEIWIDGGLMEKGYAPAGVSI